MDKDTSDYLSGASGNPYAAGWGQVGYQQHLNDRARTQREAAAAAAGNSYSGGQSSAGGGGAIGGLFVIGAGLVFLQFVFDEVIPFVRVNWLWIVLMTVASVGPYVALRLRARFIRLAYLAPEILLAISAGCAWYIGQAAFAQSVLHGMIFAEMRLLPFFSVEYWSLALPLFALSSALMTLALLLRRGHLAGSITVLRWFRTAGNFWLVMILATLTIVGLAMYGLADFQWGEQQWAALFPEAAMHVIWLSPVALGYFRRAERLVYGT